MDRPDARRPVSAAGANGGAAEELVVAPITVRHELPTRTVVKVLLVLAGLWLLGRLWTLLLALFVALLLTAALDPAVSRLERRGLPRAASVAVIVLVLAGALAGGLLLAVPPLVEQGTQFVAALPGYVDQAQVLARANPALHAWLRDAAEQGAADPGALVGGVLAAGAGLARGITALVVVLVMTAYLLADGERVYGWAVGPLPPRQRAKVRRALPAVSRVVSGYLLGQALTSLLFGVYAYAVLRILGVPQPLLLAIVAALADAIPIAGVVIATAPAALLALTVSVPAAAGILLLYLGYQQLENYVIVPRVYRGTLRIHAFAVLVAALVGAQLLGILGVLLALPVAAAVPAVARIWREEGAPAPPESAAMAEVTAAPATEPPASR